MALREQPIIPPHLAWPMDDRKRDMCRFVKIMAEDGMLHVANPAQVAGTYGLKVAVVEAEFMKHQIEGDCGK